MEAVARVGQAARVGDHMKYSELVPIHTDTFGQISGPASYAGFPRTEKAKETALATFSADMPVIRAL